MSLKSNARRKLVPWGLSFLLSLGCVGMAQAGTSAGSETTATAKVKLVDAALLDQEGRSVRFASEALAGRVVAINFVYTTCATLCPLVSANFQRLQDKLGERLGREVWLISISLDPATDTPARLKEYAGRYHARPGWLWLTGNATEVEQVLKGLGTTSAGFRDHAPLTLVGDAGRGQWSRFNALPGPEQLKAELNGLLAARKRGAGKAAPVGIKGPDAR